MDPAVGRVLANNPDGIDAILVEFPTVSGVPALTKSLQGDIEVLWLGDDENVTATSDSIISVTVTDAITERQTEAISATIVVALSVLAVFFWVTLLQPVLAFIAFGPIILVLISVLGTMALLGIPYTLITSIITALSIGIGVDYTIHAIHRYREEYAKERNPEQAAIRTPTLEWLAPRGIFSQVRGKDTGRAAGFPRGCPTLSVELCSFKRGDVDHETPV